jgi:hypothetical protein
VRRLADRRLHVGGRQRAEATGRRRLLAGGVGSAADLLEAKQDHGDVVAPAGLVGGVDQRATALAQRGGRADDLRDAPLGDHRRQPVAAQQVDVPGRAAPGGGVDQHVGLGPQRARDDRALRVRVGLLRRELPAPAHLLDERVVLGQTHELVTAQAVGTRVADVGDRDVVLADVRGRDRRAHPGALLFGLRHLVDARVGLVHASGEQLLAAGPAIGAQAALEDLDGESGGDLAGLRAAHPVGDDEDRRARVVGVLVGAPGAAGVGM